MSRRTVTLVVGVVLVVITGLIGSRLPVQYVVEGPGPTFNTLGRIDGNQVVNVVGRTPNRTSGHLNMMTVSVLDHIDVFTALRGWVESDEQVVPREVVIPPGQSTQQADRKQRQEYTSSQDSAIAAAFKQLGYPLKVSIVGLPSKSDAPGGLALNDVLTSVAGRPVSSLASLTAAVRAQRPGTTVTVAYARAGKPRTTRITTTANAAQQAQLGIIVGLQRVAPFQVTLRAPPDVGGPSAGTMFALAILDTVGPRSITGGRFIAGTGTIDADGNVGAIGGITLKMIAAKRAGATVFVVPAGNCPQARSDHPAGLPLIKVSTLAGAVSALDALRGGKPAPSC